MMSGDGEWLLVIQSIRKKRKQPEQMLPLRNNVGSRSKIPVHRARGSFL
jgi:hypothetical protein